MDLSGQSLNYQYTLNSVLVINAFMMYLVVFLTAFIQGGKSGQAGTRAKEDAFMSKGDQSETAKEVAERWKRIMTNTVETVPISFVIFALATVMVIREESRLALIVVIPVFVFSRMLYVVCYANALQPWRSLVWAVSICCALVAIFIAVIDAFRNLSDNQNSSNSV